MAGGITRRGGGRRGRRRGGRFTEINVTPFVDVMLVLLIVFMVTAPLLAVGVPVKLPKTEAKQLPAEQEPLTISILKDGKVYLQETRVEDADLVPKLQALAREGYQSRIFVRGDDGAPYGVVARVMGQINAAGYKNIGLVTDTAEKKKGK
jgi:biopolymer transport protein TolR